jgi:hypothetical protein
VTLEVKHPPSPVATLHPRAVGVLGLILLATYLASCTSEVTSDATSQEQWLAGDHHVHSEYSVSWNREVDPPVATIGRHGVYAIAKNARMARRYGLAWMVTTDHGGRHHAKINLEQAYPSILEARRAVPKVIQYFGFELNAPGADHASVIMPHTSDEAERIYELESRFDKIDADPDDPGADTVERMVEALSVMKEISPPPVVIANHPSRYAMDGEVYGRTRPADLRAWNDSAPDVAVGMVGTPGRQAAPLKPDGSIRDDRPRGNYRGQPTYGGFDRMTAELGGFWDSMLGEGRRWWITANSDSHRNWAEGGMDFWPGEYSKTFVYAERDHDSILEALRAGRVFVATGDLISELYVSATTGVGETADIGGTLGLGAGEDVTIIIRVRDPDSKNAHDDSPTVNRVDLIRGHYYEAGSEVDRNDNPSAGVIRRFGAKDWSRDGEFLKMTMQLENIDRDFYIRVRGTNTDQLEPDPDSAGEDPWDDLWFYSNPLFVEVEPTRETATPAADR